MGSLNPILNNIQELKYHYLASLCRRCSNSYSVATFVYRGGKEMRRGESHRNPLFSNLLSPQIDKQKVAWYESGGS